MKKFLYSLFAVLVTIGAFTPMTALADNGSSDNFWIRIWSICFGVGIVVVFVVLMIKRRNDRY